MWIDSLSLMRPEMLFENEFGFAAGRSRCATCWTFALQDRGANT
jgi:hypothetical protein